MMNQTINGSQSHSGILEDLAPFAERLICCDENGASFVARADELEQYGRLGLVFRDVNQVVELR